MTDVRYRACPRAFLCVESLGLYLCLRLPLSLYLFLSHFPLSPVSLYLSLLSSRFFTVSLFSLVLSLFFTLSMFFFHPLSLFFSSLVFTLYMFFFFCISLLFSLFFLYLSTYASLSVFFRSLSLPSPLKSSCHFGNNSSIRIQKFRFS